jgi:hypothetical protein
VPIWLYAFSLRSDMILAFSAISYADTSIFGGADQPLWALIA